MSHAIERTSPRGEGQPFIGRCTKCGCEGLRMGDALKPCPADEVVSDEAALLSLLDGPSEPDPAAEAQINRYRNVRTKQ